MLRQLRRGRPDVAPLFLLPPASGRVDTYEPLLSYLSCARPVYTFSVPDAAWTRDVLSLREFATCCLVAARAAQPVGPYCLGGWSYGGIVAFEMAKQLARDEQSVARLLLFDVRAPRKWIPRFDLGSRLGPLTALLGESALGRRALARLGLGDASARMMSAFGAGPLSIDEIVRLGRMASRGEAPRRPAPRTIEDTAAWFSRLPLRDDAAAAWREWRARAGADASAYEVIRLHKIWRKNLAHARRYTARGRSAGEELVLFATQANRSADVWRRLSRAPVRIVRFDIQPIGGKSAHQSMFEPVNVGRFGHALEAALRDRSEADCVARQSDASVSQPSYP